MAITSWNNSNVSFRLRPGEYPATGEFASCGQAGKSGRLRML